MWVPCAVMAGVFLTIASVALDHGQLLFGITFVLIAAAYLIIGLRDLRGGRKP